MTPPTHRDPRRGFTLVEILIVIAIIGVLAGLITTAAMSAMKAAKRTRIKVEIDNISAAFQQYKNDHGSFPPNMNDTTAMKRHFRKAFPRIATSDLAIVKQRFRTFSPAEAVVFWLGGFSADPQYPLTGPGGPLAKPDPTTESNLDGRTFLYDFDKSRLVVANYKLEGVVNGNGDRYDVLRYWYPPEGLTAPYVYYDTSRYDTLTEAEALPLVNGSTNWTSGGLQTPILSSTGNVAPLMRRTFEGATAADHRYEFVNPKSFQLLHAGIGDDWGSDDWNGNVPPNFPNGPFTGEMADNLSNFTTGALEDAAE